MSTTSAGNAKWNTCWRQAAYLSKYIYKDPPGPGGFQTHYPDKMAEIEQNWQYWLSLNNQNSSGLVTRLFKLKAWDPSDTAAPTCPPCLVFRGTDFEDMRGLAFSASVRVRWGILWKNFYINKVFDSTIPPKMSRPARGRGSVQLEFTREDLLGMGFTPISILNESGQTTVEGATSGTSLNLNLTLSADIMAKEGGDWLNNLFQGLGRGSKQYADAKTFGRRCVTEKILPLADKQMEISGHSLGGGLAAAICCVLDAENPDIKFHAMTFNASGVHAATVRPAALTDGVINNFTVEDELLTTLQSYTNTLPFVGAVFIHAARRLGMAAMPPALGTMRRVRGHSPGGDLGAKSSALPNLFPVHMQALRPSSVSAMPVLSALDQMLASSPSIAQFGSRFGQWLNARYRRAVIAEDRPWTIVGIYEGMFDRMMSEMQPELDLLTDLFMHSAEYHGMDVVIATYEAANRAPR